MELTNDQKLVSTVVAKAWEDDNFRQELVAQPMQAFRSATGQEFNLPQGATDLKVSDQTDDSYVYINIPPKPNYDDMELSDEQLEVVAGGEVGVAIVIGAIGSAVMTATLTYMIGEDKK